METCSNYTLPEMNDSCKETSLKFQKLTIDGDNVYMDGHEFAKVIDISGDVITVMTNTGIRTEIVKYH